MEKTHKQNVDKRLFIPNKYFELKSVVLNHI